MATQPKSLNDCNDCNDDDSKPKLMIGNLPEDFLRLESNGSQHQITADEEVAMALHQSQYSKMSSVNYANVKGRLDVTIVEAKLVKNYGVTRMDPYVRLRVGHQIYETRTCYNGAKNPKWNKVFHCYLPVGVDSFHVEIYDECSFTVDEMIAWVLYKIPETTLNGETVEEWVPLNGKQGDGKEGTVCIVTSFTPMSKSMVSGGSLPMVPLVMPNPYGVVYGQPNAVPVYIQAGAPPVAQNAVVISEDDIKQVQEMFPNIEIDVIKAIMESERGNKDRTINSLLQMTSESN